MQRVSVSAAAPHALTDCSQFADDGLARSPYRSRYSLNACLRVCVCVHVRNSVSVHVACMMSVLPVLHQYLRVCANCLCSLLCVVYVCVCLCASVCVCVLRPFHFGFTLCCVLCVVCCVRFACVLTPKETLLT